MRRYLILVLFIISAAPVICAQPGVRKVAAGKYELFTTSSQTAFRLIYFDSVRSFIYGRAAVCMNNKWGFIDEAGEIVIPVSFDVVEDFFHENTLACIHDKCGYYNRDGKILPAEKHITDTVVRKWKEIQINGSRSTRVAENSGIPCPGNMDFENGNFSNWQTNVGFTNSTGYINNLILPPVTWLRNMNTPNRQFLNDRYSSLPDVDYFGLFPVNPPGSGGRYALQLGNDGDIGKCNGSPCPDSRTEAARYIITVPAGAEAQNYSITFSYAVVLENPESAVNLHQPYEQPRFKVTMYDTLSHDTISCANFTFVASDPLPGFETCAYKKNVDAVVKYKSWSSVYVNLSRYAGRTLNLEFITGDCTRGGHFGYAYVDVMECGIGATAEYKCKPGFTTLTGPPGFQNYQWYDSSYANIIGLGQVVIVSPPVETTYWVITTPYSNTGCPVCDCRDTVGVTVKAAFPVAEAGPSKIICPFGSTQIGFPGSTGYSYHWSPATGLTNPDIATPFATAGANTKYTLTVTNNLTGCSSSDSLKVEVYPKPNTLFGINSEEQCFNGNNFIFTNSSSINSGSYDLTWKFGDGTLSSSTISSHTYLQPGNYHVELLTISNNGCRDSITKNVVVNPGPNLQFITGKDVAVCKGNSIDLNVSGAQSYSWIPAQFLSCADCPAPVVSPLSGSITYVVKGTTSSGCSGNDSIKIKVIEPFKIHASDAEVCQTKSVKLSASGAMNYLWTPANTLSEAHIPNPVATPFSTTTYMVIGNDGYNCFADTTYVKVTVFPTPLISLGADLELPAGSQHLLSYSLQNGPATQWLWSPSALLSCSNCPSPIANIKNDVVYFVYVTNTYGCTGTDDILIRSFCRNTQVFIPNAFTPDGDGVNDVLIIQGTGIMKIKSFRIFTRWGELVFEKLNFNVNDPACGWDGNIKGHVGLPEVFVYIAEIVCEGGTSFLYTGNVSILK
jgi:gliding motility-associated-like protein